MQRRVFSYRRVDRWGHYGGLGYISLLILGCVIGTAYFGFWGAAAGTVLLGGAALSILGRQAQRMVSTVVVSSEGIEAETHTGRQVRISWEELGALEIFNKPTIQGPLKYVQLRSRDGVKVVAVNARLPGFDDLIRCIEKCAPGVTKGKPTLLEWVSWF